MPVNIAMISTGRIADSQLAPALSEVEGARLWSVHSRDAGRGSDFARRHGAAAPQPVCTDLDALLADPALDAVIVATPDKLHAAQTIAASATRPLDPMARAEFGERTANGSFYR